MKTKLALLVFLALPLAAQVSFPNPAQSGTSLPATCTPGSLVPVIFDLVSGATAQLYQCTATNTWTIVGGGGGSCTLTVSGPSWLTWTNSGCTASGVVASQTANYFLAAPNGSAGPATFRAIVSADVPTLNQNTTGTAANVTGVVARANGGLNSSSAGTGILRDGTTPAASELSGDVTTSGSNAAMVVGLNGTLLSGLATGLLRNTTSTGVPTIATAAQILAACTGCAPLASPTFTGTVTIPTPFTLGAVSMTSTGTQLNYLASATGTTGSTNSNVVFSNSPTFVTPALGTPASGVMTNMTGLALAGTPLTTQGDILYVNATPALARLALGTNGQCLTSNGTTVVWGSCGGGSGVTSVTIAGTTNQVNVAGTCTITTTGTCTLSLPQSIATTSAPQFAQLGINVAAPSNGIEVLGATGNDGLELFNITAATSSTQQSPPLLHFQGQAWRTTATAASVAADLYQTVTAGSGAYGVVSWNLSGRVNGGAAYNSDLVYTYYGGSAYNTGYAVLTLPANYNSTVTPSATLIFSNGGGSCGGLGGTAAETIYLYQSTGTTDCSHGVNPSMQWAGFNQITTSNWAYAWTNSSSTSNTTVDTGIDRDAAGVVGITNNSSQTTTASNYRAIKASGYLAGGTTFTASGCSNGTLVGGATAGTLTLGANNCTVAITMGNSATAAHGWNCGPQDQTTAQLTAGVYQSASTTTTATFTIPATAGSTDVISFACIGF